MSETKAKSKKMAVIRIRGLVNVERSIKDTLTMLKLMKKNSCVVVDSTPSLVGMMKKVKDYVTWGEIDDKTIKLLVEKRSPKKDGSKEEGKIRAFHLNPPKGGFERKGIKEHFSAGGALGYRGEDIKQLIERMI